MLSVEILVKGKPITKYWDQAGNTFVEGRRGSDYVIRVTNSSAVKIKAVVSVDGTNVLTGNQVWEKGYVILPHSYTDIPGWRIDSQKAAKFIFADMNDGYGNGGTQNFGVIGIMGFHEVFNAFEIKTSSTLNIPNRGFQGTASPFIGGCWNTTSAIPVTFDSFSLTGHPGVVCSTTSNQTTAGVENCAAAQNSLATGWGESTTFQTHKDHTAFHASPSSTLAVYYDSAKGLERRGIQVRKTYSPNPFPGAQAASGDFGCKPPKYRRRR